jgi:hypothetical protein
MEGILTVLIVVAIIVLKQPPHNWAVQNLGGALGLPGSVLTCAKVVIVLIAAWLAWQKLSPLVSF